METTQQPGQCSAELQVFSKLPRHHKLRGVCNAGSTSNLTALPEELHVGGGGLHLQESKITALPEGLSVEGHLDLRGTKVKTLPVELSVGGNVYLPDGTVVSDVAEARKKLESARTGKHSIPGLSPG